MKHNMIKVSEAIVKCLEIEGINTIFGYPGAAICPFYDALEKSKIRHILVRHEQNAGHAASGYARITKKPSVCVVTSGPGATNLITAIATAYVDSVPFIAITGQVSRELLGHDVFQEADITGAVEPFVKHSYLIKNPDDVLRIIKEAFYISGSGRPGPVLLDIPLDVQEHLIEFDYPESVNIRSYKPSVKGHTGQIKKVIEAIKNSKKPLICAGGGVVSADAKNELKELSSLCNIPVINTMMGIGVLPYDDSLSFGMLGNHGVASANYALNNCDLLILIGARVGDRAFVKPNSVQKKTRIIHIDVDPAEIGKNMGASIPLVGDAKAILEQIIEDSVELFHDEWLCELAEKKKTRLFENRENSVEPRRFISILSEKAENNAIIAADVGQNQIWTSNYFKIKSDTSFLTTGGMGTMGYSIPAAIGAKLAAPERQVIAVCGDGSFQMQMMELATICQHEVDIKIVIMKNNRLGMVREIQTKLYDDCQIAVSLDGSPDFIKIASAYGIPSESVDSIEKADVAVERMFNSDTSYLLEVDISPDEPTI